MWVLCGVNVGTIPEMLSVVEHMGYLEQLGDVCYVHEIGDMVPKQSAVHVGKWGYP
jgi:molybdopterin synthase catalytic subunit